MNHRIHDPWCRLFWQPDSLLDFSRFVPYLSPTGLLPASLSIVGIQVEDVEPEGAESFEASHKRKHSRAYMVQLEKQNGDIRQRGEAPGLSGGCKPGAGGLRQK
jgi:hypothetical protein